MLARLEAFLRHAGAALGLREARPDILLRQPPPPSHFDEKFEQHYQAGVYRKLHRWVAQQIEPGESVVDLGCGTGEVLALLRHTNRPRLAGMDFSTRTIERLRAQYPEIEFAAGDLRDAPQYFTGFDVALLIEVLEHVVEDVLVLETACRTIRPGGRLLISVPNDRLHRDPEHVRVYSKASFPPRFSALGTAKLLRSPQRWRWLVYEFTPHESAAGARRRLESE